MALSKTKVKKSITLTRLNIKREILKFISENPGLSRPQIVDYVRSTFGPHRRPTMIQDKINHLINAGALRAERDPITEKITGLFIEDVSKYYKNLGLPESKWVTPK